LKKTEEDLPEKADSYPSLTGKFAGLKKYNYSLQPIEKKRIKS